MRIGVLGAGMIGANLARKLVGLGHEVQLANSRGPETLRELAQEIGASAMTAGDAVKDADLVIVSIPQGAVSRLPQGLFDGVADTVPVVDTGNYYPGLRDERIEAIEDGMAESVWVSRTIGRPVVKAFNCVSFTSLVDAARPAGAADRIALPVAGDDARAKARVMALVDAVGFDPVDAGTLEESWRQQPGTPAYCTDLDRPRLLLALAGADRAKAPERRDAFIAQMIPVIRQGGKIDLLALGRSIYGAP